MRSPSAWCGYVMAYSGVHSYKKEAETGGLFRVVRTNAVSWLEEPLQAHALFGIARLFRCAKAIEKVVVVVIPDGQTRDRVLV